MGQAGGVAVKTAEPDFLLVSSERTTMGNGYKLKL